MIGGGSNQLGEFVLGNLCRKPAWMHPYIQNNYIYVHIFWIYEHSDGFTNLMILTKSPSASAISDIARVRLGYMTNLNDTKKMAVANTYQVNLARFLRNTSLTRLLIFAILRQRRFEGSTGGAGGGGGGGGALGKLNSQLLNMFRLSVRSKML